MTRQSSLVACALVACLLGACQSDPYDGASVGSICADVGSQSTCDSTEICSAISAKNMCSLSCTSDSDCGLNTVTSLLDGGVDGGAIDVDGGTISNHCVDYQGSDLCMRGCSPSVPGSCKRIDFVCITQDQGGEYYCVPDCRMQASNFCSYPQQCSTNDGNCEDVLCTTDSNCTSAQICASVNGQNLCVVSCEIAGCPDDAGFQCINGGCNTVELDAYGLCGNGITGSCPSGFACASGASTSVCMPTCSGSTGASCATDSAATSSGVCESSVCVATCSLGSSCPDNTTCEATDGGAEFCVPE